MTLEIPSELVRILITEGGTSTKVSTEYGQNVHAWTVDKQDSDTIREFQGVGLGRVLDR